MDDASDSDQIGFDSDDQIAFDSDQLMALTLMPRSDLFSAYSASERQSVEDLRTEDSADQSTPDY
jgi:hypothetical protein